MSRFKVVNVAERSPGVDYITKTSVGPFIDTGVDIQLPDGRRFGRIYLSKDTVAEMARELGIIGGHASEGAIQNAYNRGLLDASKEEIGGDLITVTGTLRRWLAYVDPDTSADS